MSSFDFHTLALQAVLQQHQDPFFILSLRAHSSLPRMLTEGHTSEAAPQPLAASLGKGVVTAQVLPPLSTVLKRHFSLL